MERIVRLESDIRLQSATSKFENVADVDEKCELVLKKVLAMRLTRETHSYSVKRVGRQGKPNYNILVEVKSFGRAQSREEKSSCFLPLLERLLLVSKRCDENIQEALGNGSASKVLVV